MKIPFLRVIRVAVPLCAGAMLSAELVAKMREKRLDPSDFLRRNDAYAFFEQTGGLIKTGPTHTNVCDLRVVTVSRT